MSASRLASRGAGGVGRARSPRRVDNPASPSGTGSNLRLMLTDAPAGVDQVNIYFTSVDAKPVGGLAGAPGT